MRDAFRRRRLWLSIGAVMAGGALLAASALGDPGGRYRPRRGGTMRIVMQADIADIDPQRSYYLPEWQYEWLTGRMLLSFAHASGKRGYRLVNDGATRYEISRDGRSYTFSIRKGMRFSNGTAITAPNYKHALTRMLNPDVQSPGASFLTDSKSAEIAGATAYAAGKSKTISGIRTLGRYKLVIKLVRPSPLLLSLLALPWAMAVPTGFPMAPIVTVPFGRYKQLPSGGRYYVASRTPNRAIVIKRNRYYRGPTPGALDEFQYSVGVNGDQELLLIKRNQQDWAGDGLSPGAAAQLASQYKGNSGRYRILPTSCVYFLVMNTSRAAFRNAAVRKAVNYGIDRRALANTFGPGAGRPTDQMLVPAIPGYRDAKIYPTRPNLAKARKLARGHTGVHVNLWYGGVDYGKVSSLALLLQLQLKRIGFRNVTLHQVVGGYFSQLAHRGADFDIAGDGWCMDFPDPYDYLNKLFSGDKIQEEQNTNHSYFDNATVNRRLERAAALRPPSRYRTYGLLDIEIMRRWAPTAPYAIANDREFFSARIDPRSIRAHPVYVIDLGRIALKR